MDWKRTTMASHQTKADLTAAVILDDYMKRYKTLKPYQLALVVWNKFGKAVQGGAASRERQGFWIDHKASLQTLVHQTIQSSAQFDGRSTATVTHSLATLLASHQLEEPW
jgi:hypothetical protein